MHFTHAESNQSMYEVDAVAVTLEYDSNEDGLRILLDGMVKLPRCMSEFVRTEKANFHWEKSGDVWMILTRSVISSCRKSMPLR